MFPSASEKNGFSAAVAKDGQRSSLFFFPKAGGDEIEFDGLGAARRRLDVPHVAKALFDARQKIARSAALKNLADKCTAGFQHAFAEIECRFEQCDRAQVVGGAMAGGGRCH